MDTVKFLIEKGADLNIKDYYGSTPLHTAVRQKKLEVVRYFAERGANIDTKDDYGNTPLNPAAESGYLDIKNIL